MPNTTNFNWVTPADTDLVKDGAAAIRTLGNGIDTSLLDLKGGTTGQILSKASNTDLDYTWIANDQGDITEVQAGTGISVASGTGPIPVVTNTVATAFDAAGDLVYGTGADTFTKLSLGTAGQVLTVNSGATAPQWAAPAAGGFVGCRLSNSTTPTIANGTYTLRTYDQETFDTDGFHSTVTNTGRITIPSGKGGYYKVSSTNNWADNSTGQRTTAIYKNGNAAHYGYTAPGIAVASSISVIMNLSVGDYIETYVYQGSGGNLQIYADTQTSWFEVNYLGA